eukprot:scaffold1582_cov299-Ochromonas_danica.AAC.1
MGLSCSYDTAKRNVQCRQQQQVSVAHESLQSVASSSRKHLILYFDNYNIVNCRTRFLNNRKYTTTTPSISILYSSAENKEAIEGVFISQETPAFRVHNYEECGTSLMEGIRIPEEMEDLMDTNLNPQSLRSFSIYPSMDVRSSSFEEVYTHLVEKFLNGLCKLQDREIVLIVDPEFLLHFQKIKAKEPVKLQNLILYPAGLLSIRHRQENLSFRKSRLKLRKWEKLVGLLRFGFFSSASVLEYRTTRNFVGAMIFVSATKTLKTKTFLNALFLCVENEKSSRECVSCVPSPRSEFAIFC